MHIQKGYFFRKIIKNKILVLNFSLIILIFCAVLARMSGESDVNSSQVYFPLNNVETSKSVYSLTVNLNGDENKNDVKLLSQVLEGMDVKAAFFVTTEWIDKNEDLMAFLKNDGHYFGLQIEYDGGTKTRSKVMQFLASENDMFFSKTSEYPTFVRIISDNSGKIPELINAFGQKNISASLTYSTNEISVSEGDIITVNEVTSDTPYSLASFISKCSNNGFKPLTLESLLSLSEEKETENSK